MGEYAKFGGHEVKIGTCETMYYLRANQRMMVEALPGNVNPAGKDALSIRFRFPWPDEDHVLPGAFDNHDRGIRVDVPMPEGVDHYSVQFSARTPGYLTSLPCPEGPGPHLVPVHRNGFAGAVHLKQQKLLADGRLVPVCGCGGCGALWRVEESAEIEAIARAFYEEGNRRHKDSWTDDGLLVGHVFWHKIAQRILQGAKIDQPAWFVELAPAKRMV